MASLCLLRSVLLLSVLLASSLPALEAAQCMPEEKNPCIARCNETTFDISNLFDYPVNISEPFARLDGSQYAYRWGPCFGVNNCESFPADADCAVCQETYANCGHHLHPIWIWEAPDGRPASEYTNANFPDWRIEYTGGSLWRISIFRFIIDQKQEEPTVKFIQENAFLEYNFEVRGKCIGQDTPECREWYKKRKFRN